MFLFLGGLMSIHKPFALASITLGCIIGLTISAPAKSDFANKQTQTINYEKTPVLLFPQEEIMFKRISDVTVEEVEPQLKQVNASQVLSDKELIGILREVGFSGEGLRMAWAIVKKESSSRPYAHNDNPSTGDNSYGLFQINMRGSMGPDRREKYGLADNRDLFDPIINATVAYKMSNAGKSWGAWTTHKAARELSSSFPG